MKQLIYGLLIVVAVLFTGCADAGYDKKVESGTNVVLDGTYSTTKIGGKIVEYKWEQIQGKRVTLLNSSSSKASFVAPKVKETTTFVFQLTTVETNGYFFPFVTNDITTITVVPKTVTNTPPNALIKVSSKNIKVNDKVTFDASSSNDAEGTISSYEWTNSKGEILSSSKVFDHRFTSSGKYTISLKVTDNEGMSSSTSIVLNVQKVLESIKLSSDEISMETGTKEIITATGEYHDKTTKDLTNYITWVISDTSIVSIDKNGTIKALRAGTATIKGTLGEVESNQLSVTVKDPVVLKAIQVEPNPVALRVKGSKKLSIKALYSDGTTKNIDENLSYSIENPNIISFDGVNTISGLEKGSTSLQISLGDISSNSINVTVNEELDTSNLNLTTPMSIYAENIPANSTKKTYNEKLFGMLSGTIYDENATPLKDVTVSLLNRDEYGSVLTDSEGRYVLPVEGGESFVLRYAKKGYITSDREVNAKVKDWSIAPDVTMLKRDEKVTTISLKSTTPQIHSSTIISDDRGARATTLVFDNVTSAVVRGKDGSIRELTSLNVRATEFATPKSMPATLPVASAYTFCSDLTVDGVEDDESVEFNAPVVIYVDNFLGFDVGGVVPVGYYDRNEGRWVGSKNGVVVELLDRDGDGAIDGLDSTGDGEPNDLDNNGDFTSEVAGIKDNTRYQAGNSYWRAEIIHFTPWDLNWPYEVTPGAKPPGKNFKPNSGSDKKDDCGASVSSYVTPKSRVYHDDIPVAGTDITLHYSSKRVDGYKYIIEVSNLETPPSNVIGAFARLQIAGKILEKTIPLETSIDKVTFEWDGKDILGNTLSGILKGTLTVEYEYPMVYSNPSPRFLQTWAQPGDDPTTIRVRGVSAKLLSEKEIIVNLENTSQTNYTIANGWSLSNHNKAQSGFILKGNGEIEKKSIESGKLSHFGGGGRSYVNETYIGKHISGAKLYIQDFVMDNKGNMYISGGSFVYKVDENGIIVNIWSYHWNPLKGPIDSISLSGTFEGSNASNVEFFSVDIDVDNEGNVYILGNADDYGYSDLIIFKIDKNNIISIVAGDGRLNLRDDNIEGKLARDINFGDMHDHTPSIKVDNEGNIYLKDNYKVYKIDRNGIIITIAGTGQMNWDKRFETGKLATEIDIAPLNITVDFQGNLYINNGYNVYKVDTQGIATVVAGADLYHGRNNSFSGDGKLATKVPMNINEIEVNNKGELFIVHSHYNYNFNSSTEELRILKVDKDGIITTVVGGGDNDYSDSKALEGKLARSIKLNYKHWDYFTIDKEDNLYFVQDYQSDDIIIKVIENNIYQDQEGTDKKFHINENNTADIYDRAGIHLKTIDLQTKKSLIEYKYDSENRLSKIIDQFGNTTSIIRDSNGKPTFITAPNGQKTYLDINEKGDLISVSYENSSEYTFEYDTGSLLTQKVDPNFNSSTKIFNEYGRLIKVIDTMEEEWEFSKNISSDITEHIMKKPEGDKNVYKDSVLEDGRLKSEITLSNGDTITNIRTSDNKSLEVIKKGITEVHRYDEDPVNQKGILISSKITLPSGLSKEIDYKTSYEKNKDDLTLSKTKTVTTNGKTSTTFSDFVNGITKVISPESRIVTSEYDINTRLTSKKTSGTLNPTTFTYDSKGRKTSETTGTRVINYTYDSKGNIETVTDPLGKIKYYEYDIMDRVTKITYPNGSIEEYSYDDKGNKTKLITPTPTEFTFAYDKLDQRTGLTSPLNHQTTYKYNGNRKLTQITRPSGKTIINTYTNDRLTKTVTPETTINYSYIFADQIDTVTQGEESVDYDYDGDLLTSIAYKGNLDQTLTYSYNNDFLPKSFTYSGVTDNYTYDNDGLLLTNGTYTLTRDTDNGYVTSLKDDKLTQTRNYNSYGELIEQKDNSFGFKLLKDDSGKIIQKTETINNRSVGYNYKYDDNSRLIEVQKDNQTVESYTYDKNGNRSNATINGITTSASYTLDDQLEVYGNNSYRYDSDGYLKEKTTPDGTTTYTYSILGELKEVKTPTQTITYKHNALNQRVAKLINGVVTEKYLWKDLTTLLAIYDSNNNIVQRFNYVDSRMPVSMTQGSDKYYLHYDQVGSLRAVTDINHNIIKEIVYDTYGNIVKDTNPNFKVVFGFAGGLYDQDTKLVRFGYRDYDPYTGKWTAKDPIDFEGGDSNLYRYVLSDPVNGIDPEGKYTKYVISMMTVLAGLVNEMWDAHKTLDEVDKVYKQCSQILRQYDYLITIVNDKKCKNGESNAEELYNELLIEQEKAIYYCRQAIGRIPFD